MGHLLTVLSATKPRVGELGWKSCQYYLYYRRESLTKYSIHHAQGALDDNIFSQGAKIESTANEYRQIKLKS